MTREYLTADDLRKLERPHDFVEGLLYERCMSIWAGAPKSGKSYLLLDLAHAVACGAPWAGREVDKGNVLVIVLEGAGLLYDRVRAWEMKTGRKSPVVFSPTPLNLHTDDGDAVSEIVSYVRDNDVSLVIIDTMARATAGGNESSFEDTSVVIAALDRIKDEGGAHVAIAHHHGHGAKRARGSSDLIAAPDLIVDLERIKGSDERHATISENRHGKDGETLRFTLEQLKTDIIDSRGRAVVSATVTLQGEWFEDATAEADDADKLTGLEESALTILRARARHSDFLGPLSRDDARRLLRAKNWNGAADKSADTWGRAFRRVLEKLEEKGRIEIDSADELEIVR